MNFENHLIFNCRRDIPNSSLLTVSVELRQTNYELVAVLWHLNISVR